jgi:hypothetical protein
LHQHSEQHTSSVPEAASLRQQLADVVRANDELTDENQTLVCFAITVHCCLFCFVLFFKKILLCFVVVDSWRCNVQKHERSRS